MVNRTPIIVHGNPAHPRFTEAANLALGPLPGNPVVTVTFPYATGSYTVHVAIEVSDRDSGELRWFGFTESVPAPCSVFGGIGGTLRRAYDHELDENIYSRGVRVFDPHAGEEVAVSCG